MNCEEWVDCKPVNFVDSIGAMGVLIWESVFRWVTLMIKCSLERWVACSSAFLASMISFVYLLLASLETSLFPVVPIALPPREYRFSLNSCCLQTERV